MYINVPVRRQFDSAGQGQVTETIVEPLAQ
jgi:hypothetical protein